MPFALAAMITTLPTVPAPRTITSLDGNAPDTTRWSWRGDCSIGSIGKNVDNQRWLFFSRTDAISLRICGGSRRATDKDIAAITADLGVPATP